MFYNFIRFEEIEVFIALWWIIFFLNQIFLYTSNMHTVFLQSIYYHGTKNTIIIFI